MANVLESRIVEVTVYPSQARITRRGRITLSGGESTTVRITGLPMSMVTESVRVRGHGSGEIRGVDVGIERRSVDVAGRRRELEEELEQLSLREQEIADRRRVLDLEVRMFEATAENVGRPYGRRLATGDANDLRSLSNELSGQLAGVLAEKRGLIAQEAQLKRDTERVERELRALGGSAAPDTMVVRVDVDPGEGGELELEVSYLVHSAGWTPRYDIRLEGEQVSLSWFGEVAQHSGENWPAAELRLSTAQPSATVAIPDLEPWFLNVPEPVYARVTMPAPMAARGMPFAAGSFGDQDRTGDPMDFAMERAAMPKLEVAEAAVEHGVTATTYQIARPVAVPADGSNHQQLIAEFNWSARLDHVTAPVRDDAVYLRATIVNTSEHTLRPGRAALFHGAEFVGETDLEVLAPGEEVELALGLDDRIRVERELIARKADKAFLGATARHSATWRTKVANHTGKPARVTVIDQLPVSKSPAITVKERQVRPEVPVSDTGEVIWKLDLPEGGTAELILGVRVEIPRGTTMLGWRE